MLALAILRQNAYADTQLTGVDMYPENEPNPDVETPTEPQAIEPTSFDTQPVEPTPTTPEPATQTPYTEQPVEPTPLTPPTDITEVPVATPNPKKSPGVKLFVIIALIVVVLGAAGTGAWWWMTQRSVSSTQSTTTTDTAAQDTSTVDETPDVLAKYIQPQTGETWTGTLKPIADPGYIISGESEELHYYEVGKRGDNTIVMGVSQTMGGFNDNIDIYERHPDSTVVFIARANANADYSMDSTTDNSTNGWTNDHWASKVTIDKTIHYDSLTLPATFALDSGESVKSPTYPYSATLITDTTDSSVKAIDVKKLGSSKLIKIERTYVDTGLTAISYVVNTPIGTRINLTYHPISAATDDYSWTNSVASTGTSGGVVRGCGAAGTSLSRSDTLKDSDFVAAGTTDTGKTVYHLKDSTGGLVKVVYDEYKDFNTGVDTVTIVPLDVFVAKHAVFAYKSPVNGWLIFTLDNLAAVGGCGKPVVYLYPTKTESIDVRVGADVKISEPLYNPTNGWQNVIAQPNGQLTYNGTQYGSLYWEGTGRGAYPAITSGTIVARASAADTIRRQLVAQGLNATEVNDFMAYWQSRIPNKPYIRLAWFNTAQLNELAPLMITPKPTTVIRTFLDMKGLDQPISIPAQTFSSPTRNGFTVVEWGGLLHNPIK
jgi:hypothetical protein